MWYSQQNLAQLKNFLWPTKRGPHSKLSPTLKFTVANSKPKISLTLKFLVAEKVWDSEPKHSPSLKLPVADRAQDSQPKLSPTPPTFNQSEK